ncbi:hypothetical protein BH10CYA1_BH10CYA1_48450 [soil metagenome]
MIDVADMGIRIISGKSEFGAMIGMISHPTADSALRAAEQICFNSNRLTAPESGIETRNTVFQVDQNDYRTVCFSIDEKS